MGPPDGRSWSRRRGRCGWAAAIMGGVVAVCRAEPGRRWRRSWPRLSPALGVVSAVDLVEVAVDSIRVHMPTGQHVVILKERDAERFLPIWIGVAEANAIAIKITGIVPDRPITHDLVVTLLEQLHVEVNQIVVTSLDHDVFFARITGRVDGRSLDLDARPSDAIALAVRLGSPIYVARDVLEKAAVLPESDTEEERLRVFQEMVNSMDLPDLDDPRA